MVKPNIVMLYSGGADSYLMLHFAHIARKVVHCVMIDYGQKHVEELNYAIQQLDEKSVSWQIIKINDLNIDSGLTGNLKESRWDNVHDMNVPARNTIFISLAMSIAENMGVDEVWYGADYSDRINKFPDCYQEYVVKMNEVMSISGVNPIKLVAPLLGMSKELIMDILHKSYGITAENMYSGYDAPEVHTCSCGEDDACSNCKKEK